MDNSTKNMIRIGIALLFIGIFIVSINIHYWLKRQHALLDSQQPAAPQAWMTVWVHGSFATTLGLISVFNVIKDKVRKTNYKKMTRMMRKDPFFFQLQPLQELGLKPIQPLFDPTGLPIKHAASLVSAAYETISNTASIKAEKNYFYTFGWSGLISQYQRRKEAITLYNDLVKEYAALQAQGIQPKIRLIAHSHGGNLILNAAGIHELLQKGIEHEPTTERYPDADQFQSLSELYKLLKEYKQPLPPIAPFHIDELIMLGTPIQPETLSFCLLPFFKKIYNIYSDDDVIQEMDWVSTRRYYSEKRIALTPISTDQPSIIQLKITLNKPTMTATPPAPTEEPVAQPVSAEKNSGSTTITNTFSALWGRLFGPTNHKSALDPLHKEFWFMGWKSKDKQELAQQHIQPYPYAILIPYLQRLTTLLHDKPDLDIHLKFKPDTVRVTAYEHNQPEKKRKLFINKALLDELQTHAKAWQPDNVTPSYEMELLHRYSKMLES